MEATLGPWLLVSLIFCSSVMLTHGIHGRGGGSSDYSQRFDPATTKFALDLYKTIASATDDSKNIFFSPVSIFTALGMLKAGAKGQTAQQMEKVMNWKALTHAGISSRILGNDFKPLEANNTITMANKVWMQEAFCTSTCRKFVKTLETNYKAALGELNFATKPESARQSINKWVEDKTNNKIKDLMPSGSVNSLTRFVLTNAIYFKSKWRNQFDKKITRDGSFEAVGKDGVTERQVPFMYQNGRFFSAGYIPSAPYQLLELPYEDQGLSMIIILPSSVSELRNIEKKQQLAAEFDKMLTELYEFSESRIDVFLPKFKVSSDLKLKDYLKKMGMTDVFSPTRADLSGITGYRGLYVNAAVHKAYVNVDEEGTEAAAATGIGIALASLPFQFRVDRPFMFVIRQKKTGTILFMGRVMDPTVE